MVLHPSGGSFEHMLKISAVVMGTHTLALIAIPFILYGFLGLTKKLNGDEFYSKMAFIAILMGLFAVMCAALINGLTLPLYINQYKTASKEIIDSIKPIIYYNSSLNHAFDLVFIGSVCFAVTFWSIAVFRTQTLPMWTAYFGITLSLIAIVALIAGFVFFDLTGFRVFIAGFAIWTITIGKLLDKDTNAATNLV